MRRTWTWAAGIAAGLIALAGCGGSDNSASSGAPSSSATGGGTAAPSLKTASSALGEMVVDGKGMTVYVFDKDTADSGTSACSGDCLAKWPAVTAESDQPAVDGVTGKVGTITRDDGTTQVTLNGLPLYTYVGDAQAGDASGQGVGGVWWVVAPDGQKIAGQQPTTGGY